MIEKIKNLIETLEQEINDGYNSLPDDETNNHPFFNISDMRFVIICALLSK